ncbi:MAG: hypothetical protein QM740_12790 [Acidovorax sp.]
MHSRLPRRQWLLLAPALLAAVAAHAQSWQGGRDDEGYFQVTRATFGTQRRTIDVTERVLRLVTRDRPFVVAPDTLRADPAPGRPKTLWIEAQSRRGQMRTFAFHEGEMVDGARFRGFGDRPPPPGYPQQEGYPPQGGYPQPPAPAWEQIEQATYGNERAAYGVESRLRQLLQLGRGFQVGPHTFGGDPAPGQYKVLRVRLYGGRVMEFPEGSWVDPAQMAGGGYPR